MSKPNAAPSRGRKLVLTVGLVNVPVRLAPLAESTSVRGTRLCPDHGCPTKNQAVCSEHGHVVEEPVTGFEYGGRYVTGVDRGEHKAAGDGSIELVAAVDLDGLDPLYFEKSFLLWPDKGGEAAHDLLAEALASSGKALIGQTVMTTSTRALAIRWSEAAGTLVAHTLAYDDAVRWNDVALVSNAIQSRPEPNPAQVALADQLVATLPSTYALDEVHDDYAESLTAAIAAVADGLPAPVAAKPVEAAPTVDLMAALEASVAAAAPKKKPAAKRKTKVAA